MSDKTGKILLEYSEKFKENFPIFIVRDLNEEEIVKLVKDAIENNKPYEPEIEEGALY
ncbi:hypothetical protein [Peptoniphilus genitalis]|uniref:Uncharacterized protein n=1 Tax=Peptoniphilus genitalis TaxID=3036303 RepID=A0ABY4TNP5_9FIRM|nr:hypothetical protein [Peptoniphilus sp. SAHP1]URN40897.1 hypothetical protein M9426_06480 [Peptoniphilus sp. SAHP1]